MDPSRRSHLPAVLVLAGAAAALASSAAALALVADGEPLAWLQRAGWWGYPLLGLAVVQAVAAAVLGLRALDRPVATWSWLVLPISAVALGSLGTWRGLLTGLQVLPMADLGVRAPLWGAVRGESVAPLVMGLLVAAQGAAGIVLGAGCAAWGNAPAAARRGQWPRALAVAAGGVLLALAMAALVTGNHGDADVARWAWLTLWLLGLGLALVPAALGGGALTRATDADERAAGLRLAGQAATAAVLTVVLHALALWHAHVGQVFLRLAQASAEDAPALLASFAESLERTLLATSSGGLAAAVLALGLLLPLLWRARPGRREIGRAFVAMAPLALSGVALLALGTWSSQLAPRVFEPLAQRCPLGVLLPVADVGAGLDASEPLLVWSPQGWRVDGKAETELSALGRCEAEDPSGCHPLRAALPADLTQVGAARIFAELGRLGTRRLDLVVARTPTAAPPVDETRPPRLPRALGRELGSLASLRLERWGVLPLWLEGATWPEGVCSVRIGDAGIELRHADGSSVHLPRSPDAAANARALQGAWGNAQQRAILCGAIRLSGHDRTTVQDLVDVLAAAREREPGGAGADPFGYDPGASERALFEAVHWIP